MKLPRFAGLGLLLMLALVAVLSQSCGGSSDENRTPDASVGGARGGTTSGGARGGTTSGGARGGTTSGGAGDFSGGVSNGGAGTCSLLAESCSAHSDCCSASCDAALGACTNPAGSCKSSGESCAVPIECCTGVCDGGTCGSTVCLSDFEACTTSAECCGGRCGGAAGADTTCQPLNPGCSTAGNACTGHGDCCSKYCANGRCSGRPSYCTQLGDACAADGDCCTGICSLRSGVELGTCSEPDAPGTTGCLTAGQVCGEGATGTATADDAGIPACGGECCSRSCAPYGPTGVLICQPPSGCRPTGEICTEDTDCCGGPNLPGNGSVTCSKGDGQPVGRCDNGNACRGAGAVCKLATGSCNAENNCCAGNVNRDPTVCQQDLLGIPRCTGAGDCSQTDSLEGTSCASSADCCGLPCLPNLGAGAGDPPFICGPSCVESGGACTTHGDCCAGLPCSLAPGSSSGTCGPGDPPDEGTGGSGGSKGTGGGPGLCALYGQGCMDSSDCCNDVPCSGGQCRFIVR